MTSEFKSGRTLLLASTGLASAAALMGSVQAVQAEGMYAGLSYGFFNGETPNSSDSGVAGDPDEYELTGGAAGVFVGTKFMDLGNNMTLGGELAFTSAVEGDEDGNGGTDTSYDINWVADAKLRLGMNLGQVNVYGFVGGTTGSANAGSEGGYGFQGTNFGLGAETTFANNMFVGLEAIQRNVNSYNSSEDDTKHQAISLRVGFKF
ncbi:outer membrane beta-barrel protein [Tabrizicola sp.]|uniref:outer membrane beta-barrel protein n=1 Tax=Tabrizicola sp. TaxID=2005166 RepID=UPI00286C806C|nr:outer membrane beta-barrel protein [Tabrizicola sp.]